ncbi:cell wall protein RBR3-like isoform X2 [Haliotis rubra]|uniref:cell wall protein RBR3-like isoform X2 n=1 Tax=Haliotis rubra TaxID=36100 RepID=UPI001EE56E43|nr:cell wall protein RBR3-like isoform X2 [Haliotis rubra]
MKTFLLFAVFGIAAGVKFQYNSTDPCVMMDVEATFTTTASQGDNQLATGSVKSSEKHSVSGSCGENQATLIINFNKTDAKWTLIFSKKADTVTVTLDMMFQYDSKKMFPKKNLTHGVVIEDDEGMETLSKSDQSYVCNAQQEFKFKSTSSNNVTYTVVLSLKNLQVQAFNLSKGAYSTDVKHCAADVKSTSEGESTSSEKPSSSEEPSTSDKPSSSEEPSTSDKPSTSEEPSTSEVPSTTTRPIPQLNQYEFSNGTDTCIRMDAGILLAIMYETKDNTTISSKMFGVPKNYTLDGMCDIDGNASLTINFDNNSVTFEFTDVSDTASIKSIRFSVVQDSVRFPDAKQPGTRLKGKVDPPQIATADTTFYTCEDGEPVTFGDNSTMILSSLKWQAFNLDDGNFTKQGAQCKEDVTTTSVATTTPKPQSGPVVNNFTVSDGNTTCLVMKAALVLNIPYTDKNTENKTVEVVVPDLSPSDITGSCGDTEDSVTFSFFGGIGVSPWCSHKIN